MSRKPFVAAAARALHRIVEESVMLLNSLVLSRRKVFRAIGQKASGWPVMHSDLPDEIKRNEKIHSVLALGAKSFINATKQSPKERQRKQLFKRVFSWVAKKGAVFDYFEHRAR